MSNMRKALNEARLRKHQVTEEIRILEAWDAYKDSLPPGFIPQPGEEFWAVTTDGAKGLILEAGTPGPQLKLLFDLGVYENQLDCLMEMVFRRCRRGVRHTGKGLENLWTWNAKKSKAEIFPHSTPAEIQNAALAVLAGNAFLTEEEAVEYGTKFLPQITSMVRALI